MTHGLLSLPYVTLMTEDAPQRAHSLREVLNGPRWIVRAGVAWRLMPHALPPWYTVYHRSKRWRKAGVFEASASRQCLEGKRMKLLLPHDLVAEQSGPTDPILYYYCGWGIGWLFRRRIAMGLEMIPELRAGARILEVGYGAGLVLYNLASLASELHGLDLDADSYAVTERLYKLGVTAKLTRGSVLDMRAYYPDAFFDLVVCFSTLEHLAAVHLALDEMDRVTTGSGYLLLGMPAVNRFMEVAFQAIGFKKITDHHVTSPKRVWTLINRQTDRWEVQHRMLPQAAPFGAALYHTFLLRKHQQCSATFRER